MTPVTAALALVGLVAFVILLIALGSARSIVRPGRSCPWTDPRRGADLEFEDVLFSATDDVRLKGWFVPAPGATDEPGPAVVLVHGWLWNRLGTRSDDLLNDFPGGKPVELLPLAAALCRGGYHVLMYDMRNYGESERRGVYTAGWLESRDLLGAVDFLAARPEVDAERIGVVGFSVGGNVLLHALPFTARIRAGIAVQPADVHGFMRRYNRQVFGPLGPVVTFLTQKLHGLAGGPALAPLHPAYVAPGAGQVPVLFVQGTGDRWGGVADVERMVRVTPAAVPPIFPQTGHRFDGYNWVVGHPELVLSFLAEHMPRVSATVGAERTRRTPAAGGPKDAIPAPPAGGPDGGRVTTTVAEA